MATIAQVPQDRSYIVGLASSFTTYSTYTQAQAAAVALSAANSSAAVYTGQVEETIIGGAAGQVTLQPGTPQTWIVQLAATATYLPKATAEAQAFATSASNANGAVFVARTFQTVTGP